VSARAPLVLAVSGALLAASAAAAPAQTARVRDLVTLEQDVPRRVVGYGLVVGLEGTGDRSFGGVSGSVQTVRSVANLLRRFGVAVAPEQLRLRNVAAVLVTAEISRYFRSGARFDVHVASMGDATSLRNGLLWITPLLEDVDQAAVATAQGPLLIADDPAGRTTARAGTTGRIPNGGVLEQDPDTAGRTAPSRLLLRQPDLGVATRIAAAITTAYGPEAALAEDPGSVRLTPPQQSADSLMSFLAAVETLTVRADMAPRLIIDVRDGTIVAGGDLTVGPATVSRGAFTLTIGGSAAAAAGVVHTNPGASVQEIAAALRAAGAGPRDVAAVLASLHTVGALPVAVMVQ